MKTITKISILCLVILLLAGCKSYQVDQGPVLIADTGVDPESWVSIPAGEFLAGQFNQEIMLEYAYKIMVTEVTNQQFAQYLNEALDAGAVKIVEDEVVGFYPGDEFRGYRHEVEIDAGDWLHFPLQADGQRITFDGKRFAVQGGYENHPATNVTWFGAQAYCQYYGGRLPSDFEWEKAARGTQGWAYPWGNEISEENANYYASRDPFEEHHGRIGDTTPVGFYNGNTYEGYKTVDSASPYGAYDMVGNVEEWVGNVYENQHYRYLRGGSKAFYGYDLRVWVTNNAAPYYFSPSIGFRCAADL